MADEKALGTVNLVYANDPMNGLYQEGLRDLYTGTLRNSLEGKSVKGKEASGPVQNQTPVEIINGEIKAFAAKNKLDKPHMLYLLGQTKVDAVLGIIGGTPIAKDLGKYRVVLAGPDPPEDSYIRLRAPEEKNDPKHEQGESKLPQSNLLNNTIPVPQKGPGEPLRNSKLASGGEAMMSLDKFTGGAKFEVPVPNGKMMEWTQYKVDNSPRLRKIGGKFQNYYNTEIDRYLHDYKNGNIKESDAVSNINNLLGKFVKDNELKPNDICYLAEKVIIGLAHRKSISKSFEESGLKLNDPLSPELNMNIYVSSKSPPTAVKEDTPSEDSNQQTTT